MDKEFKQEDFFAQISTSLGIDFQQLLKNQVFDKALGSLFGAFIGDSLGSFCEFMCQQNQQQMQIVMQMNGGGIFNIKAGQLTDDSEMALHLLKGLSVYDNKKSLDEQVGNILMEISKQYITWKNSMPFDIGITCRKGISIIQNFVRMKKDIHPLQLLNQAANEIDLFNNSSLSNGSLMRIAPMGIFVGLMKKYRNEEAKTEAMKKLVRSEIKMTHTNQLAIECGQQWVELLSNLIIRQNSQFSTITGILNEFLQKQTSNELNEWKQAGRKEEKMKATQSIGFVKIAFSYGINQFQDILKNQLYQQLQLEGFYQKSMRRVISQGGDTDTNAAIVGGLIGALVGFKNLPKKYINKQLSLSLPQKQISPESRFQFYEPKKGLIELTKIFEKFR